MVLEKLGIVPGQDFFLVYCAGKCGSESLRDSLRASGCVPCERIHNIDHFFEEFARNTPKEVRQEYSMTRLFMEIQQQVRHLYVFDSYRNPIERKISSFFFRLDWNLYSCTKTKRKEWDRWTLPNKIHYFNTHYFFQRDRRNALDTEFPDFFHTPVQNGICLATLPLNTQYLPCLCIKLSFRNISQWGSQLGNLLGKEMVMVVRHRSQDYPYHKEYQEFLSHYIPTPQILYSCLEDAIFQKYNSLIEQKLYYHEWFLRKKKNEY